MDYDSGIVPWSAPEAMASIIAGQPKLFGNYIPSLVTQSLANPICHRGLIWAIIEIGRAAPRLMQPFLGLISSHLKIK